MGNIELIITPYFIGSGGVLPGQATFGLRPHGPYHGGGGKQTAVQFRRYAWGSWGNVNANIRRAADTEQLNGRDFHHEMSP